MKQQFIPVRVLRVFNLRLHSKSLVVEYVGLGFRPQRYSGYLTALQLSESRKPSNQMDSFDALDLLRNHAHELQLPGFLEEISDSLKFPNTIDEAVWEGEEFMQASIPEEFRRHLEEMPPPSTLDQDAPYAVAVRGQVPAEADKMKEWLDDWTKQVWEYARGRRLVWKPLGETPAGRECDVLTVDDAEELYPGLSALEISPVEQE
jgi:hypothetical protein